MPIGRIYTVNKMPYAPHITLNERTHTYSDPTGKVYRSVSSVLAKYKEPFDKQAVAQRTAAKTGQTVEEVLAEWATSAPHGTAVHKQLQDFFSYLDGPTDLIEPHLPTLSKWRNQTAVFIPEAILCLENFDLAGTADLLVRREDGWSILDWKTNKAIYQTSFGGKKMRGVLRHLDDCNFVHYSLQLNLYARMLGEPIRKLSIVHIPKGGDSLEVLPVPMMQDEVMAILGELAVRMAYNNNNQVQVRKGLE